MPLKILKYKLDNKHRQTVELTEGSEILSVKNQNQNYLNRPAFVLLLRLNHLLIPI